jgi:murein L,D-transpeptidase YafK
MWDELKRHIQLWLSQTKATIETNYRKWQIRHAYHPVRIALPILALLVLLCVTVGILFVAAIHLKSRNAIIVTPSHVVASDTLTSADEIDQTGEYFLAPFPAIPGHEDMNFLIVADKYDRVLHLLKNQRGIWGVIKSYPVAIGAKAGRKKIRGDKKTPEGTYFIVSRKEDSELNEIYGALA